jgi:DNA replication protein DnaC
MKNFSYETLHSNLHYLKLNIREGILEKKIRNLMKFKVLIIDEIGYLPFDGEGAHCLPISANLQTL